jgi:phosphatidylserine/phosphatidylglycerophosphate/cardiolipin synthase-like enzyme
MGSANLNDRSQKGDGDSEIALVVEDQENIPSLMDGRPVSFQPSPELMVLMWCCSTKLLDSLLHSGANCSEVRFLNITC